MKELEKAAMKGTPLPDGLSLAGQKYYLALRSLYAAFKRNEISQNDAAAEKKKLVATYTMERSQEEFLERSAIKLSQRISTAAEAFKNERTLKNADALYAAFFNISADWRESL